MASTSPAGNDPARLALGDESTQSPAFGGDDRATDGQGVEIASSHREVGLEARPCKATRRSTSRSRSKRRSSAPSRSLAPGFPTSRASDSRPRIRAIVPAACSPDSDGAPRGGSRSGRLAAPSPGAPLLGRTSRRSRRTGGGALRRPPARARGGVPAGGGAIANGTSAIRRRKRGSWATACGIDPPDGGQKPEIEEPLLWRGTEKEVAREKAAASRSRGRCGTGRGRAAARSGGSPPATDRRGRSPAGVRARRARDRWRVAPGRRPLDSRRPADRVWPGDERSQFDSRALELRVPASLPRSPDWPRDARSRAPLRAREICS